MNEPTSTAAAATGTSAERTDLKTRDHHDLSGIAAESSAHITAERQSDGGLTVVDQTNAQWLLRVLRVSAGIVVFSQMLYLMQDWRRSGARLGTILSLHIFNILIALTFVGLTHLRAYHDRLPQLIFTGCMLIFAGTAALSILTLNCAPLTITVVMMMIAAVALVP